MTVRARRLTQMLIGSTNYRRQRINARSAFPLSNQLASFETTYMGSIQTIQQDPDIATISYIRDKPTPIIKCYIHTPCIK